jgi:hypothetical protein
MQPPEIATVRILRLASIGRIQQTGHLRSVQNFEFGHFGCVKVTGLGDQRFLLLSRRSFRNSVVGVLLTQPLHGKFNSALGRFVGRHNVSVTRPNDVHYCTPPNLTGFQGSGYNCSVLMIFSLLSQRATSTPCCRCSCIVPAAAR